MRRVLTQIGIGIGVTSAAFAGLSAWSAYLTISSPEKVEARSLPAHLVEGDSDRGEKLLEVALAADRSALTEAFQWQEKLSWCGVASAVTVLNAGGRSLSQNSFFTEAVREVRPWVATTFAGMPLEDLGEMLVAHQADVTVRHASTATVDDFRAVLRANASNAEDFLIVNYDRQVVGQEGGGHISPVAAYSEEHDKLLLLDTARYKYPPHWLPVSMMFEAMDTIDSESDRSRGWAEVVVEPKPSVSAAEEG
ncbi:phytochelatin synthase [Rubidibacter lacunae KORDI 51-2]|uniref:glutathione gamma-glutamylcysteinyltransferase n=1 Tax=Rubidibacter lacunae KORDI 51-2 TaxID=582515 RepID=U5DJW8_9CHRO|nr:phytochelatin synthase family protein [Rubidibacter lacunae]ERN41197.1 phytochelatin synthase [Rubidibacter lacunae KORDI 51-2]